MDTLMNYISKIMSNIWGIAIGGMFALVGLLVFEDPSILWLKHLFVFGGLFLVVTFTASSAAHYVQSVDPNYGRVTAITQFEEESKNASNAGKAKAYGASKICTAIMLVVFSLLGASWKILTLVTVSFVIEEAVAILCTYKEYAALQEKRR